MCHFGLFLLKVFIQFFQIPGGFLKKCRNFQDFLEYIITICTVNLYNFLLNYLVRSATSARFIPHLQALITWAQMTEFEALVRATRQLFVTGLLADWLHSVAREIDRQL